MTTVTDADRRNIDELYDVIRYFEAQVSAKGIADVLLDCFWTGYTRGTGDLSAAESRARLEGAEIAREAAAKERAGIADWLDNCMYESGLADDVRNQKDKEPT